MSHASVWDLKAQQNTPKLMEFMHKFGLITARDPKGIYHSMTDVIHKVLNDITVDDWAIIIGGDSHTRMSKGVAFGADSGTVALALATGEASMPIPESVKVTFKGKWQIIWTLETSYTPPRRKCWINLEIMYSRAAS